MCIDALQPKIFHHTQLRRSDCPLIGGGAMVVVLAFKLHSPLFQDWGHTRRLS